MNTFAHFVKRNELFPPRCAVRRVPCLGAGIFLIWFSYRKKCHSKNGTHLLTVNVKRVACEDHARDSDEDIEFFHQVQRESVRKKCSGCGRMVRIRPDYAYCNSCAQKIEQGFDL